MIDKKLNQTIEAISLVTEEIEELPLTTDFARSLMKDFFIRNKLIRQSITYQCLAFLANAIKLYKDPDMSKDLTWNPFEGGVFKVGIIGGGVMGKILFELFHNRFIQGT